MAQVNVTYVCGCQFKTSDAKEAAAHVDGNSHKMWVQGTVLPSREPFKTPKYVDTDRQPIYCFKR